MNVLNTLRYMKNDIKVVVWENDIDRIQYHETEDFRPTKAEILAVDQSLVEAWAKDMPSLTAAQFHYMLVRAGLHRVVDGLMDYLEDNSHPMFAAVFGYMAAQSFEYRKTLAVVGQLRDLAALLYPEADTSEEAITTAWQEAMGWE